MAEGTTKAELVVEAAPKPRAITELIERLGFGDTAQKMSAELQELLSAVRVCWFDQRKGVKGEMTIKLKVSADPADGSIYITGDSSIKKPKRLKMGALLWVNEHGNWVEDDPRQTRLDLPGLRDTTARGEVREPKQTTGETRNV